MDCVNEKVAAFPQIVCLIKPKKKAQKKRFCLASGSHKKMSILLFSEGDSHDGAVLPVPDFQTKVPLYGRDHSRKVQAMKQAKDRKNQLARVGQTSILEPLRVDKLEPEFVSAGGRVPGRY